MLKMMHEMQQPTGIDGCGVRRDRVPVVQPRQVQKRLPRGVFVLEPRPRSPSIPRSCSVLPVQAVRRAASVPLRTGSPLREAFPREHPEPLPQVPSPVRRQHAPIEEVDYQLVDVGTLARDTVLRNEMQAASLRKGGFTMNVNGKRTTTLDGQHFNKCYCDCRMHENADGNFCKFGWRHLHLPKDVARRHYGHEVPDVDWESFGDWVALELVKKGVDHFDRFTQRHIKRRTLECAETLSHAPRPKRARLDAINNPDVDNAFIPKDTRPIQRYRAKRNLEFRRNAPAESPVELREFCHQKNVLRICHLVASQESRRSPTRCVG